jgi:ABC-type multidrug transport system fused ATPase/permease subunit
MADLIVVVDDGRIVEMGSHQELVARRGVFMLTYTRCNRSLAV